MGKIFTEWSWEMPIEDVIIDLFYILTKWVGTYGPGITCIVSSAIFARMYVENGAATLGGIILAYAGVIVLYKLMQLAFEETFKRLIMYAFCCIPWTVFIVFMMWNE